MYLYSGFSLLFHPASWTWAVPGWFSEIVTQFLALELYLRLQGATELLLALVLIGWFMPKIFVKMVAIISSLEFLFILLFSPQFAITFRDIGLLAAAITLLILAFRSSGNSLNPDSMKA